MPMKKELQVDRKAIEDALSEAMTHPSKRRPKTRMGRVIERGLDKLDEARGTDRFLTIDEPQGFRDGGAVGCKPGQVSGRGFSGSY